MLDVATQGYGYGPSAIAGSCDLALPHNLKYRQHRQHMQIFFCSLRGLATCRSAALRVPLAGGQGQFVHLSDLSFFARWLIHAQGKEGVGQEQQTCESESPSLGPGAHTSLE